MHDRRLAANVRDYDSSRAREKRVLRGWRAIVLILALGVTGASAIAAIQSWTVRDTTIALRERGVVTDARVRKVDRASKGGWYAIVDFRAQDGKTHSAEIGYGWWGSAWQAARPRRGDVAPVRYDPENPGRRIAHVGYSLDTRTETITMIVSGIVCGATVVGCVLLLRRRTAM